MIDPDAPPPAALIVNSMAHGKSFSTALGETGYSYEFVLRAFWPLLERHGEVTRIARPESQVDFAIRRLKARGKSPIHVSFRPFTDAYLSQNAPNVLYPFWEFPDIPASDYKDNPRNNWVRIANRASLILTASTFTAAALARAGVRTAVRVVPVPVSETCFEVPDWTRGQSVVIDCPAYMLRQPEVPELHAIDPDARPGPNSVAFRLKNHAKSLLRRAWVDGLKPLLPLRLSKALVQAKNAFKRAWNEGETDLPLAADQLELSGIVYTSILNPDDKRKNWQDLITAFLLALGDRDDATLVLKLAASYLAPVRELLAFYNKLGVPHRARIVLVTQYLSDEQMCELVRGSTFYVNASRAEGSCLPLQDFLAAGRPGIAPANTAMSDYFDAWVGYVVESHPEPCPWPQDDTGRLHTTWHRIVWSSLRDQFAASYQAAKNDTEAYQQLSAQSRLRMKSWACSEAVWPKLQEALELASRPRAATHVRRDAA
ncbi:MAG TPA: glycosyltransferase [Pirellulales bacterium]|nr:glycosyltransferase [Pirellulales bacterium]